LYTIGLCLRPDNYSTFTYNTKLLSIALQNQLC